MCRRWLEVVPKVVQVVLKVVPKVVEFVLKVAVVTVLGKPRAVVRVTCA